MRILAFGNSHVGAWRDAWPDLADRHPDVTMTFFSVPMMIHARYRLQADGLFRPRRNVTQAQRDRITLINGEQTCRLTDHDLAVWVGTPWQPERAAALAAVADPGGLEGDADRPALGQGFVDAALSETCTEIASAWPTLPGGTLSPVLYGRPIYAATCCDSTHRLYQSWREAAGHPAATAAFLNAYRDRLERHAAKAGVRFLAPPAHLSTPSGPTRPTMLAKGGGIVDPKAPAARGDHSHMNARYGAECIAHFLSVVQAMPAMSADLNDIRT